MEVNSRVKFTTVIKKYPSFREDVIKGTWKWLEGRQHDDNAEGLWRVHDKIYNLSDFVKHHPGGSEWIKLTKGMDITEAFECYHILPTASQVLKKFYVKEADMSRNYLLTYSENGFFKTIQRKVAAKLPFLDRSGLWKSKLCLDLIVCGFLLASILAVRSETNFWRYFFIYLASQCGGWINGASHNFTHQRKNWRAKMANLIFIGWRNFTIYHNISHHLYPNTYADFEVSAYEPHMYWIPVRRRSFGNVIYSYFISPFAYMFVYHHAMISRFFGAAQSEYRQFHLDDLITLLPPTLMFFLGNSIYSFSAFISTMITWNLIIFGAAFLYGIVAFNAGHHGITIVHEGDEFKDLDFGIHQMAATVDRIEANYNLPMALTHFGDHTLHHLFPSLDQSLLPQLRDVLIETCKEFDVELRKWSLLHAAVEQFRQLSRTEVIKLDEINNNEKI